MRSSCGTERLRNDPGPSESPAICVSKTYCNYKVIGDSFSQLCSPATRVSTNEQDTMAQASTLKAAGCERIFREKPTGGRWNRPEPQRLLRYNRQSGSVRRFESHDVATGLIRVGDFGSNGF